MTPPASAVPASPAVNPKSGAVRTSLWIWLFSLFLAGWGAKLWLIGRFGSPLPFWDHWEEARFPYIPYFEGHLTWFDLFAPHSEHRPVFTRLYGLGLLLWNGQWDARLQMVLSAAIHAFTIALLGWVAFRLLEARWRRWLWPVLAAVVVLPFGWENTLGGFQSQFYFMLLFALPTLWLLSSRPAWSGGWWLGVVTGLCAPFTVASGFIASTAVFSLIVLKIWRRPQAWRRQAPTLVVCALLTLLGLCVKGEVPWQHKLLMAHSLKDFVIAACNCLAWPWIVLPPVAVLNFLPLITLGWFYLRSREESLPLEEFTLVLGLWVVISACASGVARGAGGALPQWRYMDITSFALIVNALALLVLLSRYRERTWLGRYDALASLGWALMNVVGLLLLNQRAWQLDIPERAFYHRMQLRSTRAFMATDDIHYLMGAQFQQRASPWPYRLAWFLHDPNIRPRLPACIREPLKVTPATNTGGAFIPRGWHFRKSDPPTEISWGSYNQQGDAATGVFESQPISAGKFPYLDIEVAGNLGQPGLSLELVELASHKRIPVLPRKVSGVEWQHCEVKAPAGEFIIVATDNSPTGWFAFREPRELGALSWWSIQATRVGPALFFSGLGLYLILCAAIRPEKSSDANPCSNK